MFLSEFVQGSGSEHLSGMLQSWPADILKGICLDGSIVIVRKTVEKLMNDKEGGAP